MEKNLTQEPCKVFDLELALSRILSLLHPAEQVAARLVCHKWNDVFLSCFQSRFAVRPDIGIKNGMATLSDAITSIDPRLLSSLKFVNDISNPKGPHPFVIAGDLLCSVGEDWRLRSLTLDYVKGESFEYLIDCLNDGKFPNIKQLILSVRIGGETDCTGGPKIVASGAVQNLKKLYIKAQNSLDNNSTSTSLDIHRRRFLVTIQSLVYAAPKLRSVHTNLILDLTQSKELRHLTLEDKHTIYNPVNRMHMVESVKDRLISLNLIKDRTTRFDIFRIPPFSNLRSLHINLKAWQGEPSQPLDWTSFPSLRRLEVRGKIVGEVDYWAVWEVIFPLPPWLEELVLADFRLTTLASEDAPVLGRLLSLNLYLLRITTTWSMMTSTLMDKLYAAEMEQKERRMNAGVRERVLEFRNGRRFNFYSTRTVRMDEEPKLGSMWNEGLDYVLVKLLRNWDILVFRDF